MKKLAVLLLNLGGPKTQEDVKPFLYNLFRDKYIINLPFGLRQGLAALISSSRASSARQNYAKMGGGSPILAQTQAQAEALQSHISGLGKNMDVRVFVGMRYWHPFVEAVAADIKAFDPDEVVLLPLYPQFSSTTTLTAFEAFKRAYTGGGRVTEICCYAGNDHFIRAHSDLIDAQLSTLKIKENFRLLFSAHGLPEKIVARGDPYQMQVETTVARVMANLGKDVDHVVCYQSRVGPMKWIGPSTEEAITQAGRDGKSVLVIPIAFVSEHIETLVELDIDYAHLAKEVGVPEYVRVPALCLDINFIHALGDEVMKALDSVDRIVGDGNCQACHRFCPKKRA